MALVALVALVAVVALVAAACTGGGGGAAGGGTPTPVAPPTTAPPALVESPEPSQEPSPVEPSGGSEADREALLVELRAGDRFLELAEADRARRATWARFGYHQFAPHEDGEVLFEWANKEELWDSTAPRIRDECLLAGPEAVYPMWDAKVVIPAYAEAVWNNKTTRGRGVFVELGCSYSVSADLSPVQMWFGMLIDTGKDHAGSPSASTGPIVVHESQYDTLDEATSVTRDAMWAWVWSQPSKEQQPP